MADWFHERPELTDALLAAVLFVVGIAGVRRWPVLNESRAWFIRDVLVAGMFAPLAQRRRAPRAVLAVVCVAAVGTWIGGFFGATTVVASGLAFYGLGRYVERPASLRAFFPAAGFVAVAAAAVSLPGDGNPWFSFLGRSCVVVAGFAFGDSQRSRSALLANLRLQADRAEALRVAEAQRAVVEERGRLVRELHDVVAHSISVMVVQAVAAERLAVRQPAAAAESIRNVADVGRRALTEMRHIFDVFGQSNNFGERPTEFAPQPRLEDLDAIIAQCRNAGMIIDVARNGEPQHLSAGMELAIVRIVQEALTNAMKHAPGSPARVTLSFITDITIEVSNGPHGAGTAHLPHLLHLPHLSGPASHSPYEGRGRGLIGMRERVEALGGELSVGPPEGGGFRVLAVFPPVGSVRPAHRMATLGRSK